MNNQNSNSQNRKIRSRIMKLICISGAALVGVCLVGGGAVELSAPDDISENTDGGYYNIHIVDKPQAGEDGNPSIPDKVIHLPQNFKEDNSEIHVNDEAQGDGDGDSDIPDACAWNLLLVNPWNYITEDFSVELTQLKNGHAIDERAYPDLQKMMDDMRAEGMSPLICSSFRTNEKQQTLYDNEVSGYLAQGYSKEDAEKEAAKWVAVPGTSEHQTGLAVDIVDMNYQVLDKKQEETAVQKWLMENSWKYGFILRYPNDKSDITGIYYEPWHYRYVGIDAAKEIYENGVCLEEYLKESQSSSKYG